MAETAKVVVAGHAAITISTGSRKTQKIFLPHKPSWQSGQCRIVGPWSGLRHLTVLIDDLSAAFATVAFVGFISALVDRTYTATQYALLASIGTAGRTTLASSSGALVDWLNGDWGIFFILTAVMVIPSWICLWFIKDKLKLREK